MKNFRPKTTDIKLTIGWLYPDLMSTYGDRGNILTLKRRCEWRGITVEILPITEDTPYQRLLTIDLLFGGGSQDREQDIVMKSLRRKNQEALIKLVENNIPALFVCGAPQLMGKYYEPAIGVRIDGVGIFDMVTINPGLNSPRCIGNVAAEVQWDNLHSTHNAEFITQDSIIIGFENHGGRTYLGKNARPFAKVIKGYGNNGTDQTEGVVYKNAVGCYFHGPLLPKNPHIADFFIKRALEVKYQKEFALTPLDDSLEKKARDIIVKRLGIAV